MIPRSLWPCAVILAGGRSARMGVEKALLDAAGATLIERLAGALAPRFEAMLVSVAAEGPSEKLASAVRRAEEAARRPIATVPDRAPDLGPLAGIEASLEEIDAPLAFFAAVDAPVVSFDLVSALWREVEETGALGCMPRWSRGLEPACAVYSKCLLARVRDLLDSGRRSLQDLAAAGGIRILDLEDPATLRRVFGASPPDLAELFRNLNRPEDYDAWARSLGPR